MTRPNSLAEIAAFGLCSGCGLCAGLAKDKAVTMKMTADGFLRPNVRDDIDADEQSRLMSLCPGNHLERPQEAPALDLVWGPYHQLVKSHAADSETRFKASSGGVISAIASYLLERGEIAFVVHVGMDPAAPLRSQLMISRTREEIIRGASARYGPAAPLASIDHLLSLDQPFAVIGKPCDIAGMRNLAKVDARVDRLMRYSIAFFCAGVSSLRISESIIGKYGLQPDDVSMMRYRGHGCPGLTRIETQDGRVFEQTYDDTWSEELNQDIQFRCKICPDGTGEQADISCGDAWVGIDGYAFAEHDGWNSVITRTQRGDDLHQRMLDEGILQAEPITIADLNAMQPHQVERKMAVLARLIGLGLKRQPLPRFEGQRLLAAAWAGRDRFLQNLLGTCRRVGRGANRENTAAEDDPPARFSSRDEASGKEAIPAGWTGFLLLSPALLFMLVGLGVPLAMLCAYSFWTQSYVSVDHSFTLSNYLTIFQRPLYFQLLLRSLGVSLTTMIATVILAYPMAYLIALHGGRYRTTWLVLVAVPFWTSYLLRIFAWKVMLGYNGIINGGLTFFGLIDQPLDILLYNPFTVVLTLTHAWLPFVMLPIYVSLSKIEPSVIEAAADLGDGPWHRFVRAILPLSIPGVISGALLVFIPTVGDYVTPALVGGTSGTMIGNVIQGQFGRANNWPLGAALSVVMMLVATAGAIGIQLILSRIKRGRA